MTLGDVAPYRVEAEPGDTDRVDDAQAGDVLMPGRRLAGEEE